MTKRRYITDVPGLPLSRSPISRAVVVDKQCWISGQLSLGDDGCYLPGSAAEEASRAFHAVFAIASEAGFTPDDIVYVDIAFEDIADLDEINLLFSDLFPDDRRPARTVYQAAKLPFSAKVKVQAVAVKD